MEALWIFPIYLIIPLVAIISIIAGIITKSRSKIKLGLLLLAIPFLHLSMLHFMDKQLENKLVGNYTIDNPNPSLTLNEDGTFYLKKTMNYPYYYGKGNWDIETGEFCRLNLEFDTSEKKQLSFLFERENPTELKGSYSFYKAD